MWHYHESNLWGNQNQRFDDFYYLFTIQQFVDKSKESKPQFTKSKILVGRSRDNIGNFVDRNGNSMSYGAGELVLDSENGQFAWLKNPGGISIYSQDN